MSSRFRAVLIAASLIVSGCGEVLGPSYTISYTRSDSLQDFLGEKPNLREKVIQEVDSRFGTHPKDIRVPAGSGLPDGGLHLAGRAQIGDPEKAAPKRLVFRDLEGEVVGQQGGYALYRRQCLHCHGPSGDGYGPTAPFLFPRPRDYRRGIYKFTSTGAKPTREDLRRSIVHGLHGTSMPAYEALMSPGEIEQVLDYVIFLSMRGEFEYRLIQESKELDDSDTEGLADDIIQENLELIFSTWKDTDNRVAAPDAPRTPSSPDSLERGKALYLGKTKEQLQCSACHGLQGQGNGTTWVDLETFNHYVFDLDTSRERFKKLEAIAKANNKKWGDDWGDPIRPADLTRGVYKGGRRPIDLFWRIRNGIGQEIMPAHTNLTAAQTWDLVNFVLALPFQPSLLEESSSGPTPSAVAHR